MKMLEQLFFFYNSTLYFRVFFFCIFLLLDNYVVYLMLMSKLHRLYMETCMLETF